MDDGQRDAYDWMAPAAAAAAAAAAFGADTVDERVGVVHCTVFDMNVNSVTSLRLTRRETKHHPTLYTSGARRR
jgi:hypothetical protein